jgi:glycosyltransferase involved in cell wall biosynthesis
MHYKLPVLQRLAAMKGIELYGLFGQSHWKRSKFNSVPDVGGFDYRLLPTLDLWMPYKGRGLHVFWNPTLSRSLREIQPDVIIAGNSNFPNNLTIMRHARRSNVPYLWHGIGSMYAKATFGRAVMHRLLQRFFTNASGGLAFDSVSKTYYNEQYGIPSDRIAIAPNLVDTDAVVTDRRRYADQADTLRERLGLKGKKVVLFVGAIIPAKRLDRLVEAFVEIRTTVPDSVLLVVGDGIARGEVQAQVRRLGLESDVIFAGKRVADANLYYMLGDVFVLPGLGGLAPSQAMAHGLPVISAPADGTERDLIAEGQNGYLIGTEPDDDPVDQLIDRIVWLLSDDSLRIRMGQASLDRVEQRFNINRTADIFREMIEEAICRQVEQASHRDLAA